MKAKKFRLICLPIASFLVVLFIAITIACAIMSGPITTFLCPPIVDSAAVDAAAAEGEALAEKIMGEGAVLVKNNGTLPLSKTDADKVNFFGWGSSPHGWVVGGSGSGRVMSGKGQNDHYAETSVTEAFEEYGIDSNADLTKMYTGFCKDRPAISGGTLNSETRDFYRIVEPDIEDACYTDAIKSGALTFSDTAFIVISRIAGEAKDAPRVQYKQSASGAVTEDKNRTYLELSVEEESMVKYVSENYKNVIVLINSTNTMELGFLEKYEGIDACLVVGGTGINAATALPKLVYGEINPSGRLADTYAYALESNINYYHAGDEGEGTYTNGGDLLLVGKKQNAGAANRHGNSYVDYAEDIYLGYKWFETADAEGYWDAVGGYDKVVQYPFGYGLSYTPQDDFEWTVQEVKPSIGSTVKADDVITIKVRVKNAGDVAGQDVVQAYYTPKYTPGGIEKSEVKLCAFAKTLTPLKKDETQILTLSINVEDLASYDCYDRNNNNFSGYEIDPGEFRITLRTDAHTVKTVTFDGGETDVPASLRFNVDKNGIRYEKDTVSGASVGNKFTTDEVGAALDGVALDGSDETEIPFISRESFPAELKKAANRAISDKAKALNKYTKAMATAWNAADKDILGRDVVNTPVTNKTASGGTGKIFDGTAATELGLKLGDPANFKSEEWDALLDQVPIATMKNILAKKDLRTEAIAAIGIPAIENLDGPAQVGGFGSVDYRTVGYPNPTVIAQTFNTQLALEFGSALGKDAGQRGVKGWLGPAINMHRTPFGGRNYEYYSEDPYLTGMMCSYAVIGAKNAGEYCYLKHLALYEQETNREALYTWLTEQNFRENYLMPFRMAIRTGGVTGIMSAYGRVGAVWTGGSEALITGVVRDEWGFKGCIITDWSDNKEYMNMDQAIRAGANRNMGSYSDWLYSDTNSDDRFEQQIRTGFKQFVYMIANSYYQQQNPVAAQEKIETANVTPSFVWWIPVLIVADVLVFGGCAVWVFFAIRKKDPVTAPVTDDKA